MGPGFEIAIRAEGKHGVDLHVAKDADHDHRHGAADRRITALENTVEALAHRLAKVESEVRLARKTA